MTKKSNVYIGQGRRNNIRVMKIGKANNIKRREKQLGITIEKFSTCITEAAAFQVEYQLRTFIRQQGGIHYPKTLDWFRFDARIYSMMLQFLDEDVHSPKTTQKTIHDTDLTEEEEIKLFKAKYLELLKNEVSVLSKSLSDSKREIASLYDKVDEIRQQAREKAEQKEEFVRQREDKLQREIGQLEAKLEMLEQNNDEEK